VEEDEELVEKNLFCFWANIFRRRHRQPTPFHDIR
jgi:hypothetical protein